MKRVLSCYHTILLETLYFQSYDKPGQCIKKQSANPRDKKDHGIEVLATISVFQCLFFYMTHGKVAGKEKGQVEFKVWFAEK